MIIVSFLGVSGREFLWLRPFNPQEQAALLVERVLAEEPFGADARQYEINQTATAFSASDVNELVLPAGIDPELANSLNSSGVATFAGLVEVGSSEPESALFAGNVLQAQDSISTPSPPVTPVTGAEWQAGFALYDDVAAGTHDPGSIAEIMSNFPPVVSELIGLRGLEYASDLGAIAGSTAFLLGSTVNDQTGDAVYPAVMVLIDQLNMSSEQIAQFGLGLATLYAPVGQTGPAWLTTLLTAVHGTMSTQIAAQGGTRFDTPEDITGIAVDFAIQIGNPAIAEGFAQQRPDGMETFVQQLLGRMDSPAARLMALRMLALGQIGTPETTPTYPSSDIVAAVADGGLTSADILALHADGLFVPFVARLVDRDREVLPVGNVQAVLDLLAPLGSEILEALMMGPDASEQSRALMEALGMALGAQGLTGTTAFVRIVRRLNMMSLEQFTGMTWYPDWAARNPAAATAIDRNIQGLGNGTVVTLEQMLPQLGIPSLDIRNATQQFISPFLLNLTFGANPHRNPQPMDDDSDGSFLSDSDSDSDDEPAFTLPPRPDPGTGGFGSDSLGRPFS